MNTRIHEPDPQVLYSTGEVLRLSASTERKLVFYCRKGVVAPAATRGGEWHFDEEGLARLRCIEFLRQRQRMNWAAIEMIMQLQSEVQALREELRFRR